MINSKSSKKRLGKKSKLIAAVMLGLRLLFAEPQPKLSNSQTSRHLGQESSILGFKNQEAKQDLEGSQIIFETPSGKTILITRGGDLPPKSGPGPRAKADARSAASNRATTNTPKPKSEVSVFADGFSVQPTFPGRIGSKIDGFFNLFRSYPTPDSYHLGCSGGPRSITILSV